LFFKKSLASFVLRVKEEKTRWGMKKLSGNETESRKIEAKGIRAIINSLCFRGKGPNEITGQPDNKKVKFRIPTSAFRNIHDDTIHCASG
jgi:hypothetical protein